MASTGALKPASASGYIEPRLIHLLNDSTTPELSNADLPPFHSLPLPLPPLGRDTSQRGDRPATQHLAGEEGPSHRRTDDGRQEGSHVGSSEVHHSMRVLAGESETTESLHPSAKIPHDAPDVISDDTASKKRNRALTTRDEYLQLPQPVKKQKPAIHTSVMPPIINGLHEPPPDAALFPPIASTSFRESDSSQLKTLQDCSQASQNSEDNMNKQSPGTDKSSSKARKRATKPRRKWSEEETNHLLLGVSKHGVGKWTVILEDRDFKFDDRSAGDLKDRFRTCCPDELRASKEGSRKASPTRGRQQKPRKGLHSENILHEDEDSPVSGGMITPPTESEAPPKQRKTRAHRKKMEDLESLGIHGPFKKSVRRERRPFTDQDDREILEGLDQYGPAWTKIQRDPRFHLSSRQPTDLRDRVRNKYPSIYQRIEKGGYQTKDGSRGNDIMEPSVTMSIGNSLAPSNQVKRTGSREELPRVPLQLTELLDRNPSHSLDLGDPGAPQWLGGEMGIARLLLEDSK